MYGYLCVTVLKSGEVKNRKAGIMYSVAHGIFSSNIC